MRAKYQEENNEAVLPKMKIATVEQLMQAWFDHSIRTRGPESKLREEYRLSRFTVRNYETCVKQIVGAAGKLKLKDLNTKRIQQIRVKLQEKYAPRTIHLCLSRLKHAIAWDGRMM